MPTEAELDEWPWGKEHRNRIRVMWDDGVAVQRRDDPSWWSCGRKTKFRSVEDARAILPHMNVYQCRRCGGWHLATPKPAAQQARDKEGT